MPDYLKIDSTAHLPEEDVDIREAYPLMDAVARQEGWDDPEMDSYNPLAPADGNLRDQE